jgi:DNA-binding SARP family transcriptional activator/predicted ATPase/Tfp pilus assembly protein PilF
MMTKFTLRLAGPIQIERDGQPVQGFESDKALALLGYLALQGRAISRQRLTEMFWCELAEERGRGNLRRVLHNLATRLPGCLLIDRQSVRFDPAAPCWVDVLAFKFLADNGDIASFQAAAPLYRGELMEGLSPQDCPEFELWLVMERERWHQRVVQVLDALVEHHAQCGEYERALDYVTRLLAVMPWRERAHRQKMSLLARTGQRSAALKQYETCRHILAQELDVEPARETSALYERIRASGSVCHNLPPQPTPFVGRERELAQVAARMEEPTCRLLTLIGPGGIGKTRLALQAAGQLAESGLFPHGVYWVPLVSLSSTEFLVSSIAQSLRLSFSGSADPRAQLLGYLRDVKHELLLVLDNFEHLLPGAELLVEMLEQTPQVKLLVTSRQRLNLGWEWLFEVGGLEYPDATSVPTGLTKDSALYSAVQLFLQVAYRLDVRLSSSDDLPYVVRICQLVQGMPLGVELAAAWVRDLSCEAITRRIERHLDFLSTTVQGVPERHRSLRAVFESAWQILSPAERETFQSLSVFRGSFGSDAAEWVTGVSPDVLSALATRSLLQPVRLNRYEMLEVLRQYAAETLSASRQEQATRDRHCEYYARLLQQREEQLKGGKQAQTLDELGEEMGNIRAAWHWAVQHGKTRPLGQAWSCLARFYEMRTWFQEGMDMFANALEKLQENETLDARKMEAELVVAQVRAGLGALTARCGHYPQGKALLEVSLAEFHRLAARQETAFALNHLGIIAWAQGEYAEAQQLYRESLTIRQELGDAWGMAASLNNLGGVTYFLGEYAQAKRLLEEGLEICARIDDQFGKARSLNMLGVLTDALGEYESAQHYYEQSLAICREMGDRQGVAHTLNNLGVIAETLNILTDAQHFYEESLTIHRETGDRRGIAITLDNLGEVAHRLGNDRQARQHLEESLNIFKELGDQWGIADVARNLGEVTGTLGEESESQTYFRQALRIGMEIQAFPVVLETLIGIAECLSKSDLERACELAGLVLEHSASEKRSRSRAEYLLTSLASRLPPHVLDAARARGKAAAVEEMVQGLL